MIVYHEADPASYKALVNDGLKCTSRGEKTDNSAVIQQTDCLLDSRRPTKIHKLHISRNNNLYAYIADGETVQDITDGSFIPVSTFIQKSKQLVLAIDVDPTRCFVSDLDQYDTLKTALEQKQPTTKLHTMADNYWQLITPLSEYNLDQKTRAEIMITYDISPANIKSIWNN